MYCCSPIPGRRFEKHRKLWDRFVPQFFSILWPSSCDCRPKLLCNVVLTVFHTWWYIFWVWIIVRTTFWHIVVYQSQGDCSIMGKIAWTLDLRVQKISWQWLYYRHQSRDSVCPVCGIFLLLLDKVVKLVGGGSVIKGATLSSLKTFPVVRPPWCTRIYWPIIFTK